MRLEDGCQVGYYKMMQTQTVQTIIIIIETIVIFLLAHRILKIEVKE